MDADRSGADQAFSERLARARSGDQTALNALMASLEPKISRLVPGRVGFRLRKRIRTSDVIQNTWLDVLRDLRTFTGTSEASFVAWVATIMENGVRRQGRFFGAKKRQNEEIEFPLDESPFVGPGSTNTPSAEAASSEELALLSRALGELPEDYRQVFQLVVLEDRSHREAADLMNRSEGATRMLLSRARAALAISIERLDPGSP